MRNNMNHRDTEAQRYVGAMSRPRRANCSSQKAMTQRVSLCLCASVVEGLA